MKKKKRRKKKKEKKTWQINRKGRKRRTRKENRRGIHTHCFDSVKRKFCEFFVAHWVGFIHG